MFDSDWEKIENLFPELSTLPTALMQFQRHADLLKEASSRVRTCLLYTSPSPRD